MAKHTKGISTAAKVIGKHPVEVQRAVIETCLEFDTAFTVDEKSRSCGLSPEDVKAAYEASKCLVSALRFLKEEHTTSLLEGLNLDADIMTLLKTVASSNRTVEKIDKPFVRTLARMLAHGDQECIPRLHTGNVVAEKAGLQHKVEKPAGPLGKLVNVEWKIGVAAMSDLCKNLNSPFVMLELTVQNSAGNRSRHTIELTVPEFQKFASTMQELHGVMSTV